MVYLIVLVLLVGTVWLVAGPLLRARPAATDSARDELGRAELERVEQAEQLERVDRAEREERRIDLEAARDAKYREIRDAELDHQTGKLSDADFNAIDSTLRAEALGLLRELDALGEEP